jgi:hypothetical protein
MGTGGARLQAKRPAVTGLHKWNGGSGGACQFCGLQYRFSKKVSRGGRKYTITEYSDDGAEWSTRRPVCPGGMDRWWYEWARENVTATETENTKQENENGKT